MTRARTSIAFPAPIYSAAVTATTSTNANRGIVNAVGELSGFGKGTAAGAVEGTDPRVSLRRSHCGAAYSSPFDRRCYQTLGLRLLNEFSRVRSACAASLGHSHRV